MTVIVIGTVKVASELIDQIAESLGTSGGEVIRVLKYLCPDETPLFESFNSSELILPFILPIEPFKIPRIDFDIMVNDGYSYHPNHGESCDYLWVDPSTIHDQLKTILGYDIVRFHRKCSMQLKCFVNLRFS